MSTLGEFQSLFQLAVAINVIASASDDFRKPVVVVYRRRIDRLRKNYIALQERLTTHLADGVDDAPFRGFNGDWMRVVNVWRSFNRDMRQHEKEIHNGRLLFILLTIVSLFILFVSSALYSCQIKTIYGLIAGAVCLVPLPSMWLWSYLKARELKKRFESDLNELDNKLGDWDTNIP